jgi:hypothetical protein
MSFLAFQLPRLLGLALAIAAAACAYGLHSIRKDVTAQPAVAASEPAGLPSCAPPIQGLTSHSQGPAPATGCRTLRRTRKKTRRCVTRRRRHKPRLHTVHPAPSSGVTALGS